ncbi:MAG TPA: DUF2815 family protein [Anaerolineaceae bacterium]|nr:DUF2815 family protein [Anaerolineaceae bacterium]
MPNNSNRVNSNPMKVITGPDTRWSYANVWEAKSINGGTPKFSVSLIIPKSDTRTIAKIKAAIEAAYREGEAKLKGNGKAVPPLSAIKTPLRDGDTERPDDPAYANSYFINANSSTAPGIVDCEACYGGHILDKSENESIALTMLSKGVLAFIGSTTISYGSVTTPLIGADLLGYLILKNLRDGLSIGSAFTKAKVEFVREMNRRQGYLDGEDQKTLISFVLYGDPLVAYDPHKAALKGMPRDLYHPVVKTISDSSLPEKVAEGADPKMIAQAKNLVKPYLPGIEYAEVRIRNQQVPGWDVQRSGKHKNQSRTSVNGQVVVSFSKQVTLREKVHKQYARVTLDKAGKMVKLAVSR